MIIPVESQPTDQPKSEPKNQQYDFGYQVTPCAADKKPDPTPSEIRELTKTIRNGWSAKERKSRTVQKEEPVKAKQMQFLSDLSTSARSPIVPRDSV